MTTYLPSEAEQERLLRDLAELIASRGAATFLEAPILEPTARFLPDPWEGDLDSAQLLLRRLMLYAGLDLASDLHIYDRDDWHDPNAIGWFAGIEDGRCRFGLNVDQPDDPQDLIATLCHEIAHAWRAHHGIDQESSPEEEDRTDLTTVYLGFGILTTNPTDRYEQSGYQEGAYAFTESRITRSGYLSAQAMSFLLAVQLLARDLPPARCKAVARHLEPNQAEYMSRSLRHLKPRRAEILALLGLPPDTRGPRDMTELDLQPFTRPLQEGEREVALSAEEGVFDPDEDPIVPDWKVYALREGYGRYAILIVLGSMLGCWAALPLLPSTGAEGWVMLSGAAAGSLGMILLLGGAPRYRCTDLDCGVRIPSGAEICPGCEAPVAGRIRSRREIFEDEDPSDPDHSRTVGHVYSSRTPQN